MIDWSGVLGFPLDRGTWAWGSSPSLWGVGLADLWAASISDPACVRLDPSIAIASVAGLGCRRDLPQGPNQVSAGKSWQELGWLLC